MDPVTTPSSPTVRDQITSPTTGTFLVTGGTGALGRVLLPRLAAPDRSVRVLSRLPHESSDGVEYVQGDLLEDRGLAEAVDGVATILHCAGARKGDAEATANLVRRASALPHPPHLVFISVVGVDAVSSFAYFREKRNAELAIIGSDLPWTILRATQFFSLILDGARQAAKLPVVPVPTGFRVQAVDPDEVAARLVELALGEPAGLVPDLGGPEVSTAGEMIRAYVRSAGTRRPVVRIWLPGLRRIRQGALLVDPSVPARGTTTWSQYLATATGDVPVRGPGPIDM